MRVDRLYAIAPEVDIFIGVGTSAQVYPAARLLTFFEYVPEKYFIDPEPASDALKGYTVIPGTAAAKLPELVENICNRS